MSKEFDVTAFGAVGDGGMRTPAYSFVIDGCVDCIFKDNSMHNGATEQNMVVRGDNPSCIIADNTGDIAPPDHHTPSTQLN